LMAAHETEYILQLKALMVLAAIETSNHVEHDTKKILDIIGASRVLGTGYSEVRYVKYPVPGVFFPELSELSRKTHNSNLSRSRGVDAPLAITLNSPEEWRDDMQCVVQEYPMKLLSLRALTIVDLEKELKRISGYDSAGLVRQVNRMKVYSSYYGPRFTPCIGGALWEEDVPIASGDQKRVTDLVNDGPVSGLRVDEVITKLQLTVSPERLACTLDVMFMADIDDFGQRRWMGRRNGKPLTEYELFIANLLGDCFDRKPLQPLAPGEVPGLKEALIKQVKILGSRFSFVSVKRTLTVKAKDEAIRTALLQVPGVTFVEGTKELFEGGVYDYDGELH